MRCRTGGNLTVDVLLDDVLLTIFDFYLVKCQDSGKDFTVAVFDKNEIRAVAIAYTRVSTMEVPHFWITPSPETATLLSIRQPEIWEDVSGYLASLTSPHSGR